MSTTSRIYFILTVSTILLSLACGKYDLSFTPDCLRYNIIYLDTHYSGCGASITEYKFQERIVYFINPSCAFDQDYTIIDTNCDTLGILNGNVGKTIINGEDFYKAAKIIRTVWRN